MLCAKVRRAAAVDDRSAVDSVEIIAGWPE
jgi:hypothetical protein